MEQDPWRGFRKMRLGYLRRFRPSDYVERDLVTQLAIASFRLHRIFMQEAQADSSNLTAQRDRRKAEIHLRRVFDLILETLLKLQAKPPTPPAKEHSLRVA
ncbi:MAG TPA: hypothetical protein VM120_03105 [Bryobacteraceae bacterium]|nr:hypothetical protein [Bryobacteraceae bacterium]